MLDYTTIGQAVMFILKRKIFDEAVKLACEAFNLQEGQLYHSRTLIAVEARYCTLWALSVCLSDQELATMFGKTRQAINHLKNNRALDTTINRIAIKQISGKLQANNILGEQK